MAAPASDRSTRASAVRRRAAISRTSGDGDAAFVGAVLVRLVDLGAGARARTVGRRAALPLQPVDQVHRNVLHEDVVAPMLFGAVVDHDVAERAGGRDPRSAGGDELPGSLGVDLLAGVLLHPHAS